MRILLDECVNPRVKAAFPDHDVKTVIDMSWQGATNGRLLALAEAEGFEVFVTADQNLSHQQNIAARRLGFVVVRVKSNSVRAYLPLFSELNRAVGTVGAGQTIYVSGLA
jgi:predicted nuclease of predicted toxin-antitoxin system